VIVVGVAALILLTNLVTAVAAGIAVSVLLFLFRVSRTVVYRRYACDQVHSRKARDRQTMALLAEKGGRIVVLDLEGPIFFGSADRLAEEIESIPAHKYDCLILDFRRVTDLDTSGARFLVQAAQELEQSSKTLLLCHVQSRRRLLRIVESTGLAQATGARQLFPDADQAIEWAEDRLLERLGAPTGRPESLRLEELALCRGFDQADLDTVRALLEVRTYRQGEQILGQGETGREMYIVSRGAASVRLDVEKGRRDIRIVTFAAGTVFGELALLDAEARVASVKADTDVECYVLSQAAFDAIIGHSPLTAIKLTKNLALELASRLREGDKVIAELEY
jgi:SulP family sulfate permease